MAPIRACCRQGIHSLAQNLHRYLCLQFHMHGVSDSAPYKRISQRSNGPWVQTVRILCRYPITATSPRSRSSRLYMGPRIPQPLIIPDITSHTPASVYNYACNICTVVTAIGFEIGATSISQFQRYMVSRKSHRDLTGHSDVLNCIH